MRNNFEDKILDAIDIIVKKNLSNLDYDKTSKALVTQKYENGYYKVLFKGIERAAAALKDYGYSVGDSVYITESNEGIIILGGSTGGSSGKSVEWHDF